MRALVERLYRKYESKDVDGYCGLWSPKAPALNRRRDALRRYLSAVDRIEMKRLSMTKWKQDGDMAGVRIQMDLEYVRPGETKVETQTVNRQIDCVREAGQWLVWNDQLAEDDLAARLAAAPTEEARAALLAADRDLINSDFARALLGQGSALADRGEYSRALALLNLAKRLAEENDLPSALARAYDRLGLVYHKQGNYPAALAAYRQSLGLLRRLENSEGIFAVQNNLGSVLAEMGDVETAIEAFHQSLQAGKGIAPLPEDKQRLAIVETNIANAYNAVGNFAKAAEHLNRSLELTQAIGDVGRQAIALNTLAAVYFQQGELTLAEELLRQCLVLTGQTKEKIGLADALGNLGLILGKRTEGKAEQYDQSLALHQQSLELRVAQRDRLGESLSLNNIGNMHERRQRYAEALECYRKSLAIGEELGAKGRIANSLIGIATVYFDQGNDAQALAHLDRARTIARTSGNRETLFHISESAGRIYTRLHRLEDAHRAFEEAILAAEEMRTNVAGGEQQQERFFENKLSPYLGRAQLFLEERKPVEALQYAERAKSRVLLDVLRSGRVDIAKAMSTGEREQEKKLTEDLASLNTQLYRENMRRAPDPARVAELTQSVRKARSEQEVFQTRLYAAHPELKIQRGETPAFDLQAATASLLDAETALLEYVVTEEETHLFVITQDPAPNPGCAPCPTLKVYDTAIGREALNESVERFRKQLADHDLTFGAAAARLYETLLRKAAPQLQSKKRLIIVRDAGLWELPFQALRNEAGRYLIEDFAISYAPSLMAMAEMTRSRRARKSAPREIALLAFGNPAFGLGLGESPQRESARLAPLPSAEREVTQVARLYAPAAAKVLLGADATEARFKAEAGKAEILHLATHAILNDASPMYSQIVLALSSAERVDSNRAGEAGKASEVSEASEASEASEDGLLEAWEVMKLDLHADLVVLSACETGRGRIGAGEGLIGLTWAFFVAGAPATVVSQWKVDAESTSDLMQEFHRGLRASFGRDDALRAAELKLLRTQKYRHPFYWASFSLIGLAR